LIFGIFSGKYLSIPALLLTLLCQSARADNLILNGDFEQTSSARSSEFGMLYPQQEVSGWTTTGSNYVFLPGSADTGAASSETQPNGTTTFKLWGPKSGSANGLTASSPAGGNFVAMSANDNQPTVSRTLKQTISGLTPGELLNISFYYASAQQVGFNGSFATQLTADIGPPGLAANASPMQTTPVLSTDSRGFADWQQATMSFVIEDPTEVLSFTADSASEGTYMLLDGVSAAESIPTPEPITLTIVGLVLAGLCGFSKLRANRSQFHQTGFCEHHKDRCALSGWRLSDH
jgi:hypothetical protein